jgi:phage terminase small subunit
MEPRPLTAKQARFVDEYLIDCNATQAAIRAGYAAGCAEVTGFHLLRNPKIVPIITKRREELQAKAEVTQEYIVTKLRENLERALQAIPVLDHDGNETGEYRYDGAVANRAAELLGKTLGLFSDVNINYRNASDAELIARAKSLALGVGQAGTPAEAEPEP